MTTWMLNTDVLRLIIRQAADESSSHSPIEAFYQRSSTLRRLSLVNSQWRPLAQLELESFVVLTSRNFSVVSRAIEGSSMAKRVRTIIDRRGMTRVQKSLDDVLVRCEGLRELDCNNSTFSLNALARSKRKSITSSTPFLAAHKLSTTCNDRRSPHAFAREHHPDRRYPAPVPAFPPEEGHLVGSVRHSKGRLESTQGGRKVEC